MNTSVRREASEEEIGQAYLSQAGLLPDVQASARAAPGARMTDPVELVGFGDVSRLTHPWDAFEGTPEERMSEYLFKTGQISFEELAQRQTAHAVGVPWVGPVNKGIVGATAAAAKELGRGAREIELAYSTAKKTRRPVIAAVTPKHEREIKRVQRAQRAYDKVAAELPKRKGQAYGEWLVEHPRARDALNSLNEARNRELYARVEGRLQPQPVSPEHPFYESRQALAEHLISTYSKRRGALPPDVKKPEDIQRIIDLVEKMAFAGEHGRMWYENSARAIMSVVNGDRATAEKVAQLLAIYSPQQPILGNTSLALRAYNDFLRSGEVVVGQDWQRKAARRVLRGEGDWPGRKTNNFYRNFVEDIYAGDPAALERLGVRGDEVTNDLWMARVFGYTSDKLEQGKYDLIEGVVKQVAAETGWKPKQIQAAVWTAIKDASDDVSANINFETGFQRHLAQINYEAAIGTDPELRAAYQSWAPEVQQSFMRAKAQVVDVFVEEAGLIHQRSVFGPGVWADEISPGAQLKVGTSAAAPKRAGGTGTRLREDERNLLNATSAAIAKALKQEGVAWVRPFKPQSRGAVDLIKVGMGRGATDEEAQRLWWALNPAGPEIENFVVIHTDDGLLIRNISDVANFSRKGDDFHTLATRAVDQALGEEHPLIGYASDGELVGGDLDRHIARAFGRRRGSEQRLRFESAANRLAREADDIDAAFVASPRTAARAYAADSGRGLKPLLRELARSEEGVWRPFAGRAKKPPQAPNLPPDPEGEIIREGLKGIHWRQHEQRVLRRAERAKRSEAAGTAYERTGGGREGFAAAMNELKGELPKLEWGKFTSLDDDAINAMFAHVWGHPDLQRFEKLRSQKAILDALDGKVLTPGQVKLLKRSFPENVVDSLAGSQLRTAIDHAKTLGYEIWNVPRSLMASFDLSAPFRQGLVVGVTHPRLFFRNFNTMFRTVGSERTYHSIIAEIHDRPTWELMQEARLAVTELGDLTNREEAFLSNVAEKITGGKYSPVRASGRAYTAYLDKIRADLFDLLIDKAHAQGIDVADEKFLRSLGGYINAASGRANLGSLERYAVGLNQIFFAPRLLASRLAFLNPVWYMRQDPFVRKQAMKSAVHMLGTLGAILWLADKSGVAKVGIDPRNADFAKMRIGNTRVDLLAGFQQPMRLFAQLWAKTIISSTTGKELRLNTGEFGGLTRRDIAQRFVETKLAPSPSLINDWLKGTDFEGQPFEVKKAVVQRMLPLMAQDAYELYQEEGNLPLALASYGIGAFGIGIQTYGPKDRPSTDVPNPGRQAPFSSLPGPPGLSGP